MKEFIASILTSQLFGKILSFVFGDKIPSYRFGSFKFDCKSTLISSSLKATIFWGMYESSEMRFSKKYLDGSLDVIELGGSIGVLSTHIAKHIAPHRLLSVEAWPALAPLIYRNWRLNNINNANLLEAAVGDPNVKLYFKKGLSHIMGTVDSAVQEGDIKVRSFSLSQIVAQSGFDRFALVCDIEGSEIWFLLY